MNSRLAAAMLLVGLETPDPRLFGVPRSGDRSLVVNHKNAIAEMEAEAVIDRRLIEKAKAKHKRRYLKRLAEGRPA